MYVPNKRIKQKLTELEEEIDKYIILFREFKNPFSVVGKINGSKFSMHDYEVAKTE